MYALSVDCNAISFCSAVPQHCFSECAPPPLTGGLNGRILFDNMQICPPAVAAGTGIMFHNHNSCTIGLRRLIEIRSFANETMLASLPVDDIHQ